MTKMIFVSLPVTDLQTSIAFYKALGLSLIHISEPTRPY